MVNFSPPVVSCAQSDDFSVLPDTAAHVYDYWRRNCAETAWPRWRDIDFFELPAPLIPYLLVCDVIDGPDFRYRFWGSGHTAYHGADYSGQLVSDVRLEWTRTLLCHQYTRVLETNRPLLFVTQYESVREPVYTLRLPLSDDGETVTAILGFADRRDVTKELHDWIARHPGRAGERRENV